MNIIVIGINFRTAPIAIREQFTFREDEVSNVLSHIKKTKRVLETVLLATCNRTEIYVLTDHMPAAREHLKTFLSNRFGVSNQELHEYLYILEGRDALLHLFRVTSGLDSMVLGETQILGQVRSAFLTAQLEGATGTWFNRLFKQAITLAKRIHTETELGEHPVSVSYAALDVGKRMFGSLQDKSVLILGAGKMGVLTAKHLQSEGVKQILVSNRTSDRATELAQLFDGIPVEWDQRVNALKYVDIVVSSTGASEWVLTKKHLEDAMNKRNHRPIYLIDIAMPRDIDPTVTEVSEVKLIDLDSLSASIESNLSIREHIAARLDGWLNDEICEFEQWIALQGVVPLIQALQEKSNEIHQEMMESLTAKLPDLSIREVKIIRKLSKSVANQILREPILRLKESSGDANATTLKIAFESLFGLEERVTQINKRQVIHVSELEQCIE